MLLKNQFKHIYLTNALDPKQSMSAQFQEGHASKERAVVFRLFRMNHFQFDVVLKCNHPK